MNPDHPNGSQPLLAYWFLGVQRYAVVVILLALVSAGFCFDYTFKHLTFNTDTSDLISWDLPWRQAYRTAKEAFPQYADTIVIVVDGDTPDQTRDASLRLAKHLKRQPALFEWVYMPDALPFFRRNGLLFLSVEDLEDLADNLAKAQPFLARLQSEPGIKGLFSLLGDALTESDTDFDLRPAFDRIGTALQSVREGRRYRLSWEELMTGKDAKPEDRRAFVIVKPKLDFGSLLPGEGAMRGIRDLARKLELTVERGVRVRLTGGAALAYEELQSVSFATQNASVGALLLVTLIMFIGLRSLWLTLGTLAALILGLIFTAAFATFAVGQLNLISVAFAVMYIGLGADYAIYLCLRYAELAQLEPDRRDALKRAVFHVGGSLTLCTITTSIGFFAFIPTDYSGVAELGLISGGGMFISLGVTLAILPALLSVIPKVPRTNGKQLTGLPFPGMLKFPLRHAKSVCITAAVLATAAVLVLPASSFDDNPLNLQDPANESVQTFKELLATSERSPWSLVVLEKSLAAARATKARMQALPSVDDVITIESFVPEDQSEKLPIIEDMALTLGPELVTASATVAAVAPSRETLEIFRATLSGYLLEHPEAQASASGARLEREIEAFLKHLRSLDGAAGERALRALETALTASLPGRLDSLRDSLDAAMVGLDDLPEELTQRWISPQGTVRIEVFPRGNLNDSEALERFVSEVRSVKSDVSGVPVNYLEGGRAVVTAFQQAFLSSLLIITVVLAVFMERKRDIVLVLTPLLLAALLTGATAVVLGIPFNFANIIALPLLLGMGVDNGIHMVHRFRTAPPDDGTLLNTSTARAVVLSALTNTSAFSNLAISPHQGTASMGVLLSVGIVLMMLCTLIVLPSLLALLGSGKQRPMQTA
ncbi:MAG: MMPL family transporter [Pseudomonadota bacterium]|nr:MMPL family transporter [Pseudomonadota bacterium]